MHDHREFVAGCFRCDLSRDEVSGDPLDLLTHLAESIERARRDQRRRDAIPCGRCGGDRLRADFVDPDRCHVPAANAGEGK